MAVAIPRITDDFHALNDVGWYASSYLLTTCCESSLPVSRRVDLKALLTITLSISTVVRKVLHDVSGEMGLSDGAVSF